MAKYEKGRSGNPKGRPKGSANYKKLREAILREAPDIIDAMISHAKSGDTTAARTLLDRVIPPLKAGDTLINLPLSGKMTDDARSVVIAVGKSELTPGQGQVLLNSLATLSKIIEIDDLVKRVEKLENENANYEATNPFVRTSKK